MLVELLEKMPLPCSATLCFATGGHEAKWRHIYLLKPNQHNVRRRGTGYVASIMRASATPMPFSSNDMQRVLDRCNKRAKRGAHMRKIRKILAPAKHVNKQRSYAANHNARPVVVHVPCDYHDVQIMAVAVEIIMGGWGRHDCLSNCGPCVAGGLQGIG